MKSWEKRGPGDSPACTRVGGAAFSLFLWLYINYAVVKSTMKQNAKSDKKVFSTFDLNLVPGSSLGEVCVPRT